MSDTDRISIGDILAGRNGNGWLYLPDGDWTLETQGVFVPYGKDDAAPDTIEGGALRITLDSDAIEDIIGNAEQQVGTPDIDQLFEAFVHYCRNDAFIEF